MIYNYLLLSIYFMLLVYRKIANIRKNTLDKLTTYLALKQTDSNIKFECMI